MVWIIGAPIILTAQDLSDLKGQKPVKISGSIGAGTDFYSSNETYESRDPFSWNLYGSVVANVYGISLPFSFVVSQYSTSYSAPFSQFGISPSYKWLTVHLGYRSMSLSPLIFEGQNFLGAGVELRPGKFRIGGFYGRLNKSITEDTTFDHRIEPQYSRMGYGLKLGMEMKRGSFDFQFFHAKDDENSIPEIVDSLNNLRPQANTAVGNSFTFNLLKIFSFEGKMAFSLINRDETYEPIDSIGHYQVPGFVRTFSPINYTTTFSYAGRGRLSVNLGRTYLSLGYQRIQPDYLSLGIPYTVNDVESYSAMANTGFAKGRLNIAASYGDQHNNLNKSLASELHSRTGNLALNANLSKHFNVSMNANGAQVFQKDGTLKLDDDLRMDQLMMNYSVAPSYMTNSERMQHLVSASVGYTDLNDRNPTTKDMTGGDNINSSLNYAIQFLKSFVGVNLGSTYSVYGQGDYKYRSTGINIGGNVQLLKERQLGLQASVGYFFNHSGDGQTANNTNFTLSGSTTVKKSSFSIYGSYVLTPPINLNPLDKVYRVPYAVNTRNLSLGISYGYQF